jgi:hypothetical protein
MISRKFLDCHSNDVTRRISRTKCALGKSQVHARQSAHQRNVVFAVCARAARQECVTQPVYVTLRLISTKTAAMYTESGFGYYLDPSGRSATSTYETRPLKANRTGSHLANRSEQQRLSDLSGSCSFPSIKRPRWNWIYNIQLHQPFNRNLPEIMLSIIHVPHLLVPLN